MTRTRILMPFFRALTTTPTTSVIPKFDQATIYSQRNHTLRSPAQRNFSSTGATQIKTPSMSGSMFALPRGYTSSSHSPYEFYVGKQIEYLIKDFFVSSHKNESFMEDLMKLMIKLPKPLEEKGYPYFLACNLRKIVLDPMDYAILRVLLMRASHPDIAQLIGDYFQNVRRWSAMKEESSKNNDDYDEECELLREQHRQIDLSQFINIDQRLANAFFQSDTDQYLDVFRQIKQYFGEPKFMSFDFDYLAMRVNFGEDFKALSARQISIQESYQDLLESQREYREVQKMRENILSAETARASVSRHGFGRRSS